MFVGNQQQFAVDAFGERLARLLEGIDAGNGTPAADVVISALEVDRRIAGVGQDDLMDKSDAAVRLLAFDILDAVVSERTRIELPFGTVLETKDFGDIRIGGEAWLLDAGRPGLHPMETTSKAAHGPNLDLLHLHISQLTRRLACRRLGLPRPVFVCDNDDRHLLQFEPLPEAGDVVLQRWANGTDAPRFSAALPWQIKDFARSIVKDMRALWKRREDIAKQVAEVRAIAEATVAGHDAEVEAIILDLSGQADDPELDMYLHYIGVDVAMRRGTVLDFVPGGMRKRCRYRGAPYGLEERNEELRELHSHGAHGKITQAAAAILACRHVDRESIIAELCSTYDSTFAITTATTPIYGGFYWHNGVIRADVTMHDTFDWSRTQLDLIGLKLPSVAVASLAGRKLSDIAELPFGGHLQIEEAKDLGWGIRLHIEEREMLINLDSGDIWEIPPDV